MIDQPIPYKLTRTAVVALAEVIQQLAIDRMIESPDRYPTLYLAIESVLGDAGHKDMAKMWEASRACSCAGDLLPCRDCQWRQKGGVL